MSAEPLVHELIPAPDPWETAQRLASLPHLLFLDSAERHAQLGRYSYVAAQPVEWIEQTTSQFEGNDPFATLHARWRQLGRKSIPGLPPFQGGIAGLFGYGLANTIEKLPHFRFDEFQVPDLAVGVYDWVIAFDHQLDRAWLFTRNQEQR